MEEKNEINEIKEIKEIKEDMLLNSKKENYLLIFSNVEEQFNLFKLYQEIINENKEKYRKLIDSFDNVNPKVMNFLEKHDYETIKKSPIFHLADILKEIHLAELRDLSNIFVSYYQRQEMIIYAIRKFLESYETLKKIDSNRKNILTKMNEKCRKIEIKIINDYLKENYQKHVSNKPKFDFKKETEKVNNLSRQFCDNPEFSPRNMISLEKTILDNLTNVIRDIKDIFSNSIIGKNDTKLNKIKTDIESLVTESKSIKFDELLNSEVQLTPENMKYKFLVIEDPNIPVKHKKKEKSHHTLNAQDISNILVELEKYFNKQCINFPKAKELMKIKELTNKLIMGDKNKKELPDDEYEELYKLISNKENITTFLITLTNLRSHNILGENTYKKLLAIFEKIRDFPLKNIDSKIAINLIILSESFYLKRDKKETIGDDIKKGSLFKNSSFWAGAMITEFEHNLKKLNLDIYQLKKNGLTNKTLSHAEEFVKAQFIPYLLHKVNFEVPDDIFKESIKMVIDEYKISDEIKNFIEELKPPEK